MIQFTALSYVQVYPRRDWHDHDYRFPHARHRNVARKGWYLALELP